MSKKTSQNTREILISEVQTKPSLWDDTHPEYKNCERNKKIWAEIGKIAGLTGHDAKDKWKNLKDKFRKELQKIPISRSGEGGSEYRSKWPFFNSMMFVKDTIIPSSMSGNLGIEENSQKSFSGASDNESFIEIVDTPLTADAEALSPSTSISQTTSTSNYYTKHSINPNIKKRRIERDNTQKIIELEEQKIAILQKAQDSEKKPENPDAQFLLSLLPYFN
ncbi:transcription factor Adf-1-like [Acyrthosiphon pisum]|uniref:MADF domain-containing protein n=1 Tax=Acyrthosiphon pisum TaxID=7029 RepID=A0A8R2NUH5_ACYPI|nr:transcription factor Adf-1-like [Acyrthosiphon pisum]